MNPQMKHSVTAQDSAHSLRTATAEQRWAAGSAIVGGALAALLTSGVLTGAVLASYNALGDVGRAAHIPDLPAYGLHALAVALDGLAGVALLTLIVLQPDAQMRRYCWLLVGGCIGISMLANGAHAVFDDEHGHLVLPILVAFLISTVPAASAAAALHLILLIAHHVINRVRTLLAGEPLPERAPAPLTTAQPPAAEPGRIAQSSSSSPPTDDAQDPRVVELARNPRAGYRTVMKATSWGRPRSETALKAARDALRTAQSTFRHEPAMSGPREVAA